MCVKETTSPSIQRVHIVDGVSSIKKLFLGGESSNDWVNKLFIYNIFIIYFYLVVLFFIVTIFIINVLFIIYLIVFVMS